MNICNTILNLMSNEHTVCNKKINKKKPVYLMMKKQNIQQKYFQHNLKTSVCSVQYEVSYFNVVIRAVFSNIKIKSDYQHSSSPAKKTLHFYCSFD